MSNQFDIVIRNGTLVDGSGGEPYAGDLAIKDGRIAAVGRFDGTGAEEIDATGRIVTPGFVDIHTHYDGHATWTNRLEPSSQHGVTTVIAGNCGVGFAPCKAEDRERLITLMEGVEDIPEPVMSAGLPWTWQSFPEYLDVLASRKFDVDIATQIPHAPLRVYVMGERAATREAATAEDIARMRGLVREAIEAGALGFSTSRSINHKASDGSITPTYAAMGEELVGIAGALREIDKGVLQIISDWDDPDAEFAIVRRMIAEADRPLSLSLMQMPHAPELWRKVLAHVIAARADDDEIRTQVCGRPVGVMMGLDFSRNPFMLCPAYLEIADLPLEQRRERMRDPQVRERILSEREASADTERFRLMSNFGNMYEMEDGSDYEPAKSDNLEARAEREGRTAAEVAYDVLVSGSGVIYIPAANFTDNSLDAINTLIANPARVLGLGDGGAHCGMICDASLPTYMLTRWVRHEGEPEDSHRMPLAEVVRALSAETAAAVGLMDRGLLKPGMRADVNVIDIDNIALHRPAAYADLPNGAFRLGQPATGYDATIVAGEVTYRKGKPTGALPGRLVRGAQAPAEPTAAN